MRRIAIVAAAVVVVALAGLVYYLLTNLNALVAQQIEQHGSRLTGTRVSVGRVAIALREGRGSVGRVTIANPTGFEAAEAFRLSEIGVALDPAGVGRSPLVLDEVVIAGPEVFFEVDGSGRSNLQEILDRVRRPTAEPAGEGASGPDGGTSGSSAPLRLRIRRFTFRDGTVAADTRALGGKRARVEMPALTLTDLGGAKGAPPAEIGQQVLRAYAERVARQVAASQVRGKLDRVIDKELGGEAGEAAKGLLKQLFD